MAAQKGTQREYLLSLNLDDPLRKHLIAHEVNLIVERPLGDEYGLSWWEQSEWLNIGFQGRQGTGFDMNEEPYLKGFAAYQSTWARDGDLAELPRVLKQYQTHLNSINKVVCFGLGSPHAAWEVVASAEGFEHADVWRSSCQYATALELAKLFKEFNGCKEIHVFAQDPELTLMEINAFPKVGITVVNPYLHEGFGLIDSNTFVFSISLDFAAKLEDIILATSQPAGMVSSPEGQFRRLRNAILNEYTEVPCNAFRDQSVIYKRIEYVAPLARGRLFILKS
ncbi:hypothetical protein F5B21DRAFT_495634 [Xylaria acuta]|nr:hypothetical protein F5B21DRAFT_495634 [Xylaria acuta]